MNNSPTWDLSGQLARLTGSPVIRRTHPVLLMVLRTWSRRGERETAQLRPLGQTSHGRIEKLVLVGLSLISFYFFIKFLHTRRRRRRCPTLLLIYDSDHSGCSENENFQEQKSSWSISMPGRPCLAICEGGTESDLGVSWLYIRFHVKPPFYK